MAKLGPVKISWIIRQKESGRITTKVIAGTIGVSHGWVKKLRSRYKKEGTLPQLGRPGRRPVMVPIQDRSLSAKHGKNMMIPVL